MCVIFWHVSACSVAEVTNIWEECQSWGLKSKLSSSLMWDLRFSEWWLWRAPSSGIWGHVAHCMSADILWECVTSIFIVQECVKEETSMKHAASKIGCLPYPSSVRMEALHSSEILVNFCTTWHHIKHLDLISSKGKFLRTLRESLGQTGYVHQWLHLAKLYPRCMKNCWSNHDPKTW
jgi:hypothetical protein